MKSSKSYILCIDQKKLLKKYITVLWNQWMNQTKVNTIFMNSENSKTFDPHKLSLNLMDKIGLRQKGKCIALSSLSIYYT